MPFPHTPALPSLRIRIHRLSSPPLKSSCHLLLKQTASAGSIDTERIIAQVIAAAESTAIVDTGTVRARRAISILRALPLLLIKARRGFLVVAAVSHAVGIGLAESGAEVRARALGVV